MVNRSRSNHWCWKSSDVKSLLHIFEGNKSVIGQSNPEPVVSELDAKDVSGFHQYRAT